MRVLSRGWFKELAFFLFAGLVVPVVSADTVALKPVADTTLFSPSSGNNLGAENTMAVGDTAHNQPMRGLLRFDLSSIPAGATINSAKLEFSVTKSPPGGVASTVRAFKMLKSWTEGTGKGGTPVGSAAKTGETTWVNRVHATEKWSTAGGAPDVEYASAISGSVAVNAVARYSMTGAGLATDVQAWLDQPGSNAGWILIGDKERVPSTARRLGSREASATRTPTLTVDFTVQQVQLGSISGTVSKDTNNDDLGDAPLAGVTVQLFADTNADGAPDGDAVASTTTAADGTYSFLGLLAGGYVIVETDPAGFQSVSDGDSTADTAGSPGDAANASPTDNRLPVTLAAGEADTGNDFVDEPQPLAGIAGTVRKDNDNNGTGDIGVAGVEVKLFADANADGSPDGSALSTVNTSDDGTYSLTGLAAGNYVVVETVPAGNQAVADGDSIADAVDSPPDVPDTNPVDGQVAVTLAAGETDSGNDFVFRPQSLAAITGTVRKDNDNNGTGDVGVGAVAMKLFADANADGAPDGNALSSVNTADDGSYSFAGLAAGSYVVVETVPAGNQAVADGDSIADAVDSPADVPNTNAVDGQVAVTLAAGETDSGNDFLLAALPAIPPQIVRFGKVGDRFEVEFHAEAGNIYEVQFTDTIVPPGPWQVLTNVIAKLITTNVVASDAINAAPARFYRVADVGDVD